MPEEAKDADGEVTNQTAIDSWKQKDITARNYIYATTDHTNQRLLVNCKSSREMWEKLSAQYLQNADTSKHMIQHQFFTYKYQPDHKVQI